MKAAKTILVVPCYNEAERLDCPAFKRFAASCDDTRVLFVNDGSTDDTESVLKELCAAHPDEFEYHALPENRGKAEAVRIGMTKALSAESTYVGYWDADLSTDFDEVPRFVEALDERSDIVCVFGCRVRRLGAAVYRSSQRHYLGRVFATLVSLLLGIGIYDSQCGAKLFRATREIREIFAAPFISKWIFDVELIARLLSGRTNMEISDSTVPILELPLRAWRDVEGSKLRPHHMFLALGDLVQIYRCYRLDRSSLLARRSSVPGLDR